MTESWYADPVGTKSQTIFKEEESMLEFLEAEAWQAYKERNKITVVTTEIVTDYIEKG